MSVYDSTVAMLDLLSEEDLKAVNGIIKRLLIGSQKSLYRQLSKEEMLKQLSEARQEFKEGRFESAEQVTEELGKKYGFL